ncbi:MAG: SCO family protein [Phycisphaeraceae bacterium]|nr:SCO family protein [Phycisphaeraceae bacterium]MCW5762388.1 SCO family protein [Phycisphaeraceae bacterium]
MSKQRAPIGIIAACAVVVASAATAVVILLGPSRHRSTEVILDAAIIPGQTPDLLQGMEIPPFNLIDQNGNPVDQTMFEGKLTIVDFFFTRCPGPCPMMTQQMRRLQQALAGTSVQFASFSVDSQNEPPEVLAAYARANGADTSNWTFITGDDAQIYRIATEGLYFALERDPSIQIDIGGGQTTDNIIHPTHLILIGPGREVWALAGFTNEEHIQLLIDRTRTLAKRIERR